MEDNSLSIYMKELRDINVLSLEKEQELAKRIAAGDIEARNELVQANLRLVITLAKHYQGCGLSLEDLIQEGNIGLIKAANKFDLSKGYRFATYAIWWIKQTLSRSIAEKGRTIRLPVYIVEQINRYRAMNRKLTIQLGRDPSDEEIIEVLSISEEELKKIKDNIADISSLDVAIGDEDDGGTLGDFIEDPHQVNPAELYLFNSNEDIIDKILNTLTKREADIIRKQFGFYGKVPMSIDELGEEYHLTKERIRQIEIKALRKLRHPSRANVLKECFNS